MSTTPKVDRHPEVILEPRSVSVALAAKALGISERSAWNETQSGALRSFRYPAGSTRGRVLVPVAALDEWTAAHLGGDAA